MNSTKRGEKNGKGTEPGDNGSNRLDQVRELLFGEQARDVDHRIAELENRLGKKLEALQNDMVKRFEAAQKSNQAMFDKLRESLEREAETRADSARQLSADLERTGSDLGKKIDDLDERSHASLTQLEQQLASRADALKADIGSLAASSSAALAEASNDLGDRKADRTALAAMFTELAEQLSGGSPRKKG